MLEDRAAGTTPSGQDSELGRFLIWYGRALDNLLGRLRSEALAIANPSSGPSGTCDEQIALIVTLTDDLVQLKDDSLEMAAVAEGSARPMPRLTDLAALAEAISRRIGSSNCRVQPPEPFAVRADPGWIVRLAGSLAAARLLTEPEGGQVEVSLAASPDAQSWTLRLAAPVEPPRLAKTLVKALDGEVNIGPTEVSVRFPR